VQTIGTIWRKNRINNGDSYGCARETNILSSNITEQVEKVKKRLRKTGPTVVLAYIQDHPSDVNTIADLATKLGLKHGTVKKYAHQLAQDGQIYRFKVRGHGSHYGTKDALQEFEKKLETEGFAGKFIGVKQKKTKVAAAQWSSA
jgi:L-rhamnose isomerase